MLQDYMHVVGIFCKIHCEYVSALTVGEYGISEFAMIQPLKIAGYGRAVKTKINWVCRCTVGQTACKTREIDSLAYRKRCCVSRPAPCHKRICSRRDVDIHHIIA